MTAFSLLAPTARHLLAELLFLAALAQLALCLSQQAFRSAPQRRAADGVLLAALLIFCSFVTAAMDGGRPAAFPWLPIPSAAALVFVHAALGIRRARRESRATLSPASVRQALDKLNAAVLFADETGTAVLVNDAMGRLADTLLGSFPQTRGELEDALRAPPADGGVTPLGEAAGLYRFPDGRVWRFRTVPLADPALVGFTQTDAQDVTELYEANARLKEENDALREANAKMKKMLERIADYIREEETLRLKMRIHNEIGTSLIALSEIAAGNSSEDVGAMLEKLEFAAGLFAGDRSAADAPGALEDVRRQAEALGILLAVKGAVPGGAAEELIAAAARECVTNCARHAGGDRVDVAVESRADGVAVTVTNSGAPPAGPIREGGGLSALRRRVERAGGTLAIGHTPRFILTMTLPGKEPET